MYLLRTSAANGGATPRIARVAPSSRPFERATGTRQYHVVPRFKLVIEYTGTRYSGWQIQKNARTVQGEIDRAIRDVTNRTEFELYASGRTDAGVHALAQIAHLDVY